VGIVVGQPYEIQILDKWANPHRVSLQQLHVIFASQGDYHVFKQEILSAQERIFASTLYPVFLSDRSVQVYLGEAAYLSNRIEEVFSLVAQTAQDSSYVKHAYT